MKILQKLSKVSASFLLGLAVSNAYAAPTTINYDINNTTHTFEGFGSMIWNSAGGTSNPGGSQIQRLTDMHNDAPSLRLVRINHETRTYNQTLCGTAVPLNYTYAQYVSYWGNCGDGGLVGQYSVEPTQQNLDYVFLGGVPGSFKNTSNELTTDRLQDYANYLAAGVYDFYTSYGKWPKYVEISNEPDGNWSTYINTANYNTLVKNFYTALQTGCGCDANVQIVGAGVSRINWSASGDTYTQALDATAVADLGHWSVHTWIQDSGVSENSNTGQAALLSTNNWPTWANGVKNKNATKPIMVTEFATFANRYYYSLFSSKTFSSPNYMLTNTAAYTVPFAVRVYNNAISAIGANVGPTATAPYGASSVIYWQAAAQSWDQNSGAGYTLIDQNTNFQSNPQVLTPIYKSLSPLFKSIPIGSKVVRAKNTQNQSNDVFSVVFWDALSKCATVAMVNGTYSDRSISSSTTRITKINGLPSGSTIKSVTAQRFRQTAAGSSNAFSPILENLNLASNVSHSSSTNTTTFTTPYSSSGGLPMHSHLTTQICYN